MSQRIHRTSLATFAAQVDIRGWVNAGKCVLFAGTTALLLGRCLHEASLSIWVQRVFILHVLIHRRVAQICPITDLTFEIPTVHVMSGSSLAGNPVLVTIIS